MTGRVCIIGDSHAGCILAASLLWKSHGQAPTFFVGHLDIIEKLQAAGVQLCSDDPDVVSTLRAFSGGKDLIDVSAYDYFVVIGLGFWLGVAVDMCHDYVAYSMRNATWQRNIPISDLVWKQTVIDRLTDTTHFRLISKLRKITDRPILSIPAPNPASGVEEAKISSWYPPFGRAESLGCGDFLWKSFHQSCIQLECSFDCSIVHPDERVRETSLFNKREYSLLCAETTDMTGAMSHGSDSYGMLLVEAICQILEY